MKKISKLSFLLIPVFIATPLSAISCKKGDTEVKMDEATKSFYFELDANNKAIITGFARIQFDQNNNLKPEFKNVVIPSKVTFKNNTYDVAAIGTEAFIKTSQIESVTIPASVKFIGERAFMNCSKLKWIKFENFENSELDSILQNAFTNCNSLEEVQLPKKLLIVGEYAFSNIKNDKFKVTINSAYTNKDIKMAFGQYVFNNTNKNFQLIFKHLTKNSIENADKIDNFAKSLGIQTSQITFA
ncbi:leucine-rich repeat domain-containing protein [Mycoplasmopsis primatum]|uniref:leucine-rich repeat domain-containing protein n=1 Tax=Mycoplasmopsis primatum TaxID=55604 RepID=UPI0004974059|nr:leucine-rich repeat domain-containing protein [Mycoplasmopsis primatum]